MEILSSALTNYVDLFVKNLNLNPLDFVSLPALAEHVMWSQFSEKIGSAYSFDRADVSNILRDARIGGITIILNTRHVEVDVAETDRIFAKEVYTVPNGDTIKMVKSWDFNNLYG